MCSLTRERNSRGLLGHAENTAQNVKGKRPKSGRRRGQSTQEKKTCKVLCDARGPGGSVLAQMGTLMLIGGGGEAGQKGLI